MAAAPPEVIQLGSSDTGGARGRSSDDSTPEYLQSAGGAQQQPPSATSAKMTPSEAVGLVKRGERRNTFDVNSLKPAEQAVHQRLCMGLCGFGTSSIFGTHLRQLGFDLRPHTLKARPTKELEGLHTRVRTACMGMTTGDQMSKTVFALCQAVETFCVHSKRINSRLKIKGLTEVLTRDETVLQQLELVRLLSSGDLLSLPPHWALALTIIGTAGKVHAVNQYISKSAAHKRKREEVEEEKKEGDPPPPSPKQDDDSAAPATTAPPTPPPKKRRRRKKQEILVIPSSSTKEA